MKTKTACLVHSQKRTSAERGCNTYCHLKSISVPSCFFSNMSFAVLARQEVALNRGNSNFAGFGLVSFLACYLSPWKVSSQYVQEPRSPLPWAPQAFHPPQRHVLALLPTAAGGCPRCPPWGHPCLTQSTAPRLSNPQASKCQQPEMPGVLTTPRSSLDRRSVPFPHSVFSRSASSVPICHTGPP